jgi:hypothetical protein
VRDGVASTLGVTRLPALLVLHGSRLEDFTLASAPLTAAQVRAGSAIGDDGEARGRRMLDGGGAAAGGAGGADGLSHDRIVKFLTEHQKATLAALQAAEERRRIQKEQREQQLEQQSKAHAKAAVGRRLTKGSRSVGVVTRTGWSLLRGVQCVPSSLPA